MINKIFTGIEFIDKGIGGIYQYGNYLICGEKETGKTVLTSQFFVEGLKKNEMCLFVMYENPGSYLTEIQNSLGFDFSVYLKKGIFNILQYEKTGKSSSAKLQQYMFELSTFINKKGVERVVIDFLTVIDMLDEKTTEEEIKDFVKFLEKLHVTALLLLDKPRSPEMFKIERSLIKETVGTFRIEKKRSETNGRYFYNMEIEKLAGHFPPFPAWNFEIFKHAGSKQITESSKISYSNIKEIKKTEEGG